MRADLFAHLAGAPFLALQASQDAGTPLFVFPPAVAAAEAAISAGIGIAKQALEFGTQVSQLKDDKQSIKTIRFTFGVYGVPSADQGDVKQSPPSLSVKTNCLKLTMALVRGADQHHQTHYFAEILTDIPMELDGSPSVTQACVKAMREYLDSDVGKALKANLDAIQSFWLGYRMAKNQHRQTLWALFQDVRLHAFGPLGFKTNGFSLYIRDLWGAPVTDAEFKQPYGAGFWHYTIQNAK